MQYDRNDNLFVVILHPQTTYKQSRLSHLARRMCKSTQSTIFNITMTNKKFGAIALALCSALSLSLISCGDDDSNEDNKSSQAQSHNGHQYVDLGLESGTLWATCNIGASSPWESGDMYAFGETETKSCYDWKTYKHCNGSSKQLTKYCLSEDEGIVDGKSELDDIDDVAVQKWGGKWKLPTRDQIFELLTDCYWVYTDKYNGKDIPGSIAYKAKSEKDKGVKISKGDKPSSEYNVAKDVHVFFPFAGEYLDNKVIVEGECGEYQSRSLSLGEHHSYLSWTLLVGEQTSGYQTFPRIIGRTVRPVCVLSEK